MVEMGGNIKTGKWDLTVPLPPLFSSSLALQIDLQKFTSDCY